MLVIMGRIEVEEGTLEKVKDALVTMENETHKEDGCITYAFATDVAAPTTVIRIIERWESMDALAAHTSSPHMAEFGKAIGTLAPKSMDIKCYEVGEEVKIPM